MLHIYGISRLRVKFQKYRNQQKALSSNLKSVFWFYTLLNNRASVLQVGDVRVITLSYHVPKAKSFQLCAYAVYVIASCYITDHHEC